MKSCEYCKNALINTYNEKMYCKIKKVDKAKDDLCENYIKDRRKLRLLYMEKAKS